ncbi:MAG: hypothetical protein ABIW33_02460, partial [Sphingomicrobium sp.]
NHYFGAPAHIRTPAVIAERQPSLGPATEAQARCDAIQSEFRSSAPQRRSIRREAPPLARALVPTDDLLSLRLAEELDYVRRLLDQMGDALIADPTVLVRHGVALQSVDVVGQVLGHLASVIRSSDPGGAVDRIGMSDLKGRLLRKSIA